MSIEILRRGERPADRSYEASCYVCKSELKWAKKDATRIWDGDQRDGPFTQIACPVCGATVTGY